MEVETVEINGVIVNVGEEEKAAKWAKDKEPVEEEESEEAPAKKKGK